MRPLPHRQPVERRERDRLVRQLTRVQGEHQDLREDEVWIAVQEF